MSSVQFLQKAKNTSERHHQLYIALYSRRTKILITRWLFLWHKHRSLTHSCPEDSNFTSSVFLNNPWTVFEAQLNLDPSLLTEPRPNKPSKPARNYFLGLQRGGGGYRKHTRCFIDYSVMASGCGTLVRTTVGYDRLKTKMKPLPFQQ